MRVWSLSGWVATCVLACVQPEPAQSAAPPVAGPWASLGSPAFAHSETVRSASWSPDGEWLATVASDVRLWRRSTGRCEKQFPIGGAISVAFHPDGARLAVGALDGKVWLVGVADGRSRLLFREEENAIWNLAFSPSGQALAWATSGKTVSLYDTRSGKVTDSFDAGHVVRLAFTPDGKGIVAESPNRVLPCFDAANRKRLPSVVFPELDDPKRTGPLPPGGVVWTPEGRGMRLATLAVGRAVWSLDSGFGLKACLLRREGEILLLDHVTGNWHRFDRVAEGSELSLSLDGKWLAAYGVGTVARVWDVRSGAELFRMGCPLGPVVAAHFDAPGSVTATDATGALRSFVISDETPARPRTGFDVGRHQPKFAVLPGRDGKIAVVAGWVIVYEVATGRVTARIADSGAVEGVMYRCAASGRDELAVVRTPEEDEGAVEFFDLRTGKPTRLARIPHSTRDAFAASRCGGYFAIDVPRNVNSIKAVVDPNTKETKFVPARSAKGLYVYDATTGKRLHAIQDPPRGLHELAFSHDGRYLAGVGWCGDLWLWESKTGKPPRPFRPGAIRARTVAFSPDGKSLACADGGRVAVYDVSTLALRQAHWHGQGEVTAMDFSPDSRLIATGGADTTVKLWPASSK